MTLKLFYDCMSAPSRAVLLFIWVNKIPCQETLVELRKNDTKTPEYAKINPLKKIPAIMHGDFHLGESVAIFRYLTREFKPQISSNWYPEDSKTQARIDEYNSWQPSNIRTFATLYFLHKYLFPARTGQASDPKRLEKSLVELESSLQDFRDHFLQKGGFIAGASPSIADLLAGEELIGPVMVGYKMEEKFPEIADYLKRLQNALEPDYSEVHKVTNDFAKYYETVWSKKGPSKL